MAEQHANVKNHCIVDFERLSLKRGEMVVLRYVDSLLIKIQRKEGC